MVYETIHSIDPVFKNIVVAIVRRGVIRLWQALGESIRTVEGTLHMYKLKLEHQNGHNPMVYTSRRLNVRVL